MLNKEETTENERISRIGYIFTRIVYKLNFNLKNKSNSLLGLDILRDNTKRDLLITISLLLEKKLISLMRSGLTFSQTETLRHLYAILVCQVLEKFLFKYYGYPIKIQEKVVHKSLCSQILMEDIRILLQTPVSSLRDPKSKLFQTIFSPIYSQVTDSFLESLFENLIIEISNNVLFILVTDFSDIYEVRQNLYKSKFLSIRNLERFKNNFIWQITLKATIQRPKNIYSSQYGLWVIRTTGVYYRVVYANRSKELLNLRKLPLATVTLIEVLDFTSSRFDEFFYVLGNSLRFTLTSVIGQIIGLIWKGIIEGLKR